MGFSIPSSARLPTPKELESETGLQTYLSKTFASDEELLSELEVRIQPGIVFDSYGSFFEFLSEEGFTLPQAWSGRAGGSGLYADPSEYYKKIAPGSAKPASTSAKKSAPKPTYASRADELAAKQPAVYDRYMELDPFEKSGGIDAELVEIMKDPQAFSDYVAVQGLQDAFPQAVSGVVGVESAEEFYDALYDKYDASGSLLMTYEEQTGFKTTEGAYNHLKAYEENLYQKGLDHVESLLSRGDSGASNLNIKLFGVYLEAYLENPQDSMATFRALEGVLSHWNNSADTDGRGNVAVLSGFYHDIVNNLSYAQKQELRKLYLSEGGASSPDQNPLLVGDIPQPVMNAISRMQATTGTVLSQLAWIDSRASYAEGPRKLFEDARDLIAETLADSKGETSPSGIYDRIAHFPEGPARDKIYAEIGIKKEWVAQIYDDLKWRVPKGSKDLLHFYEKNKRPADCPQPSWEIACDIAYSQFNSMVADAALMGLRFVCVIGLAVVGGMTGGVGGAILAAGLGGGAGAALDVHDMTEELDRAYVNYYSDVDGAGLGSYRQVEIAQKDVDYAIACGVVSTAASMVTAPLSVVGGEALKQFGVKGLGLAMAHISMDSAMGVVDGTVMALSDGRIMDVEHNQEKLRLAGDEDGAKNYTPVTGVILSVTLGGVIGGGFSTGGEALGGVLKLLKPPRGTGGASGGGTPGSRFGIRIDFSDPTQPPKASILVPDGNGGATEVAAKVVELDEATGRVVLELPDGTRLEAAVDSGPVHVERTRVRDEDGDETLELDAEDGDDTLELDADDDVADVAVRTRAADDEEGLEELPLDDDPDGIDLAGYDDGIPELDADDDVAAVAARARGADDLDERTESDFDDIEVIDDSENTVPSMWLQGSDAPSPDSPREPTQVDPSRVGVPRDEARRAESTVPEGMRVARPATATPGRQLATQDIGRITDVGSLLAYTNGLISRARLARETGRIPDDVVLADFMNADGPITTADYFFVADALLTRLNQLGNEAADDVVLAVSRRIDELRLLASNREAAQPVRTATPPAGRTVNFQSYNSWARNVTSYEDARGMLRSLLVTTLPRRQGSETLTPEAYAGCYRVLQTLADRATAMVEAGDMTRADFAKLISDIQVARLGVEKNPGIESFRPADVDLLTVNVREPAPRIGDAVVYNKESLSARLSDEYLVLDEAYGRYINEGALLARAEYEGYQAKVIELEREIARLEQSGVDVASLRQDLKAYTDLLLAFDFVAPAVEPTAAPRVNRPRRGGSGSPHVETQPSLDGGSASAAATPVPVSTEAPEVMRVSGREAPTADSSNAAADAATTQFLRSGSTTDFLSLPSAAEKVRALRQIAAELRNHPEHLGDFAGLMENTLSTMGVRFLYGQHGVALDMPEGMQIGSLEREILDRELGDLLRDVGGLIQQVFTDRVSTTRLGLESYVVDGRVVALVGPRGIPMPIPYAGRPQNFGGMTRPRTVVTEGVVGGDGNPQYVIRLIDSEGGLSPYTGDPQIMEIGGVAYSVAPNGQAVRVPPKNQANIYCVESGRVGWMQEVDGAYHFVVYERGDSGVPGLPSKTENTLRYDGKLYLRQPDGSLKLAGDGYYPGRRLWQVRDGQVHEIGTNGSGWVSGPGVDFSSNTPTYFDPQQRRPVAFWDAQRGSWVALDQNYQCIDPTFNGQKYSLVYNQEGTQPLDGRYYSSDEMDRHKSEDLKKLGPAQ